MKKLFFFLLLLPFLNSCKKDDTTTPAVKEYNVEYEVKCQDCTVEYSERGGALNSIEVYQNTWIYSFKGLEGQTISIKATSHILGLLNNVKGSIKVNGVIKLEDSRTGASASTPVVVSLSMEL